MIIGWLANRAGDDLASDCIDAVLEVRQAAADAAARLREGAAPALASLLNAVGAKVAVTESSISIAIDSTAAAKRFGGVGDGDCPPITLVAPMAMVKRGQEMRIVIAGDDSLPPPRIDNTLIQLLARAERAHRALLAACPQDRTERGQLVRLARLTTLAPDIVTAILAGQQPASLTARRLLRTPQLPLAWAEQRQQLGFR